MRMLTTVLATAVAVALSGVASAATLYTPMLQSGGAPNVHDCQILNVSGESLVVTVGIIDYQGTAEFEETVGIGPGAGMGIAWTGLSQAYCRISFEGDENAIRASLCVEPAGSSLCQAAVEAR